MNKAELVAQIAKVAELTKVEAGNALDGFVSAVTGALKKGDSVTIVDFGTFKVSARAARKGRNPQTGKEIAIKAKKVPTFKAGKGLKDVVAGKAKKK